MLSGIVSYSKDWFKHSHLPSQLEGSLISTWLTFAWHRDGSFPHSYFSRLIAIEDNGNPQRLHQGFLRASNLCSFKPCCRYYPGRNFNIPFVHSSLDIVILISINQVTALFTGDSGSIAHFSPFNIFLIYHVLPGSLSDDLKDQNSLKLFSINHYLSTNITKQLIPAYTNMYFHKKSLNQIHLETLVATLFRSL